MLIHIKREGLPPRAGCSQEQGVRMHFIRCPLDEQEWVRNARRRQVSGPRSRAVYSSYSVKRAEAAAYRALQRSRQERKNGQERRK